MNSDDIKIGDSVIINISESREKVSFIISDDISFYEQFKGRDNFYKSSVLLTEKAYFEMETEDEKRSYWGARTIERKERVEKYRIEKYMNA